MKQLIKIKNSDLSFKLNLNYNNVYSRLKMLLGNKASLFADIATKSTGTTWYSADDAEYTSLDQAPKGEANNLSNALSNEVAAVRKEMMADSELSKYVDDILEIPDNSFVFYSTLPTGGYKFVLTGWGCRFIHQNTTDPNSGFIKRISRDLDFPEEPQSTGTDKPSMTDILKGLGAATAAGTTEAPKQETHGKAEMPNLGTLGSTSGNQATTSNVQSSEGTKEQPKHEVKKQSVSVKVLDQNNSGVKGEPVIVRSSVGEKNLSTNDDGIVNIGELPYGETFSVEFPNLQGHVERSFEVIPGVDNYDAYIKKLIKYSPVLFVEDQNGNAVQDYNVKVVVNGQDSIFNSGMDGVVQLPTMQEGQKFIVIDTANYANTEEYNINQAEAKTPYHFHIKRAEKAKVGITVLDKSGKPIPKATVDLAIGDTPCQQITAEDGRAEFPGDVFVAGDIPVNLTIKGKGLIKSNLKYSPDNTEYTIQLQDKKPGGNGKGFNWKWLALIPLLLLLGWGGYKLSNMRWGTPTWEELQKGVVLVKSEELYYVTTGLPESTGYSILFFTYDSNSRQIENETFDIENAKYQISWGTGFFISDDGKIATNRHVADPIAPEDQIISILKHYFVQKQDFCDKKAQFFQGMMNQYTSYRLVNPALNAKLQEIQDSLDFYKTGSQFYDQIQKLCNYKVKSKCDTYVVFDDVTLDLNKIESESEPFHPCTLLASGKPGDVTSNDLAIIQLKEKEKIMPKDAYIYKIPDRDPFENEKIANDDYKIWVLGYSEGPVLANTGQGIHPHHPTGAISSTQDRYLVQFTCANEGGSSGGPVLNEKRELVAINNSGINATQIRYGVRTKYLKELYEEVLNNNNKTK